MAGRENIRIPVFSDEFLFNIYETTEILKDDVDLGWIDENWQPEVWETYVGPRYDKITHYELFRLLKYETCPFCRIKMTKIDEDVQPGKVLVCYECFYWGGRGTRGWIEGPTDARANLGRMKVIENLDDVVIVYSRNKCPLSTPNYFV